MVIRRGEIWWANLPEPRGSEPGYRRPVLVVQSDTFNRSRINTVLVVPITSNLHWSDAPGNVLLGRDQSGLRKESVVNISQVMALDKNFLTERVKSLPATLIDNVDAGLRLVLSL